jgi:hypothetical protein
VADFTKSILLKFEQKHEARDLRLKKVRVNSRNGSTKSIYIFNMTCKCTLLVLAYVRRSTRLASKIMSFSVLIALELSLFSNEMISWRFLQNFVNVMVWLIVEKLGSTCNKEEKKGMKYIRFLVQ